ncbi:hypothetical protein BaRGS_00023661 [Batillaria attramentaria]|uniref:DUF4062 domain-containing protein n=1 Tax=Batillaria attramentaria TaxID=370345 RepID=A0ABD0KDN9_9CAEN
MPKPKDGGSQFELRRPVTPYVCSTPADFQEERDWLSTHVFPKLTDVCRARGTHFSPVDVRWSSEDTTAQDGHLLRLLLDLVAGSSPYFLCLLGECYGPYRPEGSQPIKASVGQHAVQTSKADGDWLDLNFSMAAQCGHGWVLQDGHQNCSIPELEIIAATFRGRSQQCTFYYRQSEHLELRFPDLTDEELDEAAKPFLAESEHAGLKMQTLRQTIVKKGLPVSYFKTPQELGDLVLKDWIEILDNVYPPLADNGSFLDTAQYSQWLEREALLSRLQSTFVSSSAMESVLQQLTDFALSSLDTPPPPPEAEFKDTASMHSQSASTVFRQKPQVETPKYQSILLLSGDRGAGKSVALAHWLKDIAQDKFHGLCLIHSLVGASPGNGDIAVFLRQCVRDLRKQFLLTEVASCDDFDEGNSSWWSDSDAATPDDFPKLCQAFVAAAGLGPCILVLDGINDLSATHGLSQQEVKEFEWLPYPLPPHCRIIFSTTSADLSFRSLSRRGDVSVVMAPGIGDVSQKMSHLEAYLRPHVVPRIRSRKRQVCEMRMLVSPLALCVLGSELNSYSIHTDLDPYLDTHCETGSLRAFWTSCLQQWILEHSWTRDDEASVASKDDGQFDYTGWVADTLCLLAVSRGGLRQDELLQILEALGYAGPLQVTVLHWVQFRQRAGALLWETADGRIRFSHQHLQDITEYILLRSVSSATGDVTMMTAPAPHQMGKRKMHAHLATFFAQQPLSWRQLQELPWHLLMSGNLGQLLAYLTHGRVVHTLLAQRDRFPDAHHDLRLYWRALAQQGQLSGPHYLRTLKDLGLYTLPASFQTQLEKAASGDDDDVWLPQPEVIFSVEIEGQGVTSAIPYVSTPRFMPETVVPQQTDSGFFLTSPDQQLAIPDILDGVDSEVKKAVLASLAFAVAEFLLGDHQTRAGTMLLSSLLSYLQASFPLSVDTQFLLVRALERLGTQSVQDGDLQAAVSLYHQALRFTFDLDELDEDQCDHRQVDTFKGVLLGHHGYLQMVEGDVLEAGELLKEATESISHLTGNHVLRATLLYHTGLLRLRLAEYSRSESSLRQSLALRLQWHGQYHPEVADVLLALARLLNTPAYTRQFEQPEVEGLYRRALVVSERCLGSKDLQVSQILLELGEVVASEGSQQALAEARDLLQRSLDMRTTMLGADDVGTRAARQSVRKVEVALQLGQNDLSARRSGDPQGMRTKQGSRGLRHAYPAQAGQARGRAGSRAGLGSQIDIRSVSRESVLRHNRPDSIMSSAYSLMSASERLLASRPQSGAVPKVKAGSRITSATSSVGGRASLSVGWSAKSPFLTEGPPDLDEEDEALVSQREGVPPTQDSAGEREKGEPEGQRPESGSASPRRQLVVDLELGQRRTEGDASAREADAARGDAVDDDTPRLDSFAVHLDDGTILIGERPPAAKQRTAPAGGRKRVSMRPASAPRRLFQRYASAASNGNTSSTVVSVKPRPASQRSAFRSRMWSGRSGVTSVGSTGSHVSRCRVPGPHDIHPSNARSLQGPHSDISSLLGPPPAPRDNVATHLHHRSAFYHVPGRYPTNLQKYPPRRCQKTEGARLIDSVLSIKLAQAHRLGEMYPLPPSGSARAPSLGVNENDVTFIVRQTGVIRPNSYGDAILSSARATPDRVVETEAPAVTPAVKFREPIAVK